MGFKPQEYLVSAVKSGDLIEVRVALCGYIRVAPGNRVEILGAKAYIEGQCPHLNLMESHEGSPFREKKDWCEEYIWKLISELMENFSEERINHIIEVGEYLYLPKRSTTSSTKPQKTPTGGSPREANQGRVHKEEAATKEFQQQPVKREAVRQQYTRRDLGSSTSKKHQRIVAVAAVTLMGAAILWYLLGKN